MISAYFITACTISFLLGCGIMWKIKAKEVKNIEGIAYGYSKLAHEYRSRLDKKSK